LTKKYMPELLLRDYDRCVRCLHHTSIRPVTRDHVIPKYAADRMPLILTSVVWSRRNEAPACREDHDIIENQKFRAYQESGVVGIVNYVGNRYPKPHYGDMLQVQRRQFAHLFDGIVQNILDLNGDYGDHNESTVKRLLDRSLEYWEQFRQ
jgi:hypothetical protein